MIRSTHGLHPYYIVGFSRWALCCVPRLTESHFTSFSVKDFRKRSDLLYSRPEIYALMLSHRRQSARSLSPPQPGQCILIFATTPAKTRGSGNTNWSSSARTSYLLHFRMELTMSAALFDGLFQSTIFPLDRPVGRYGVQLEHDLTHDMCRFATMSS